MRTHWTRKKLTAGALALLLGAALLQGSPATAAFPATSTDKIGNWAPSFMQWPLKVTWQESIELAQRYDVFAATQTVVRQHVGWMRFANPDIQIFDYMNGGMVREEEVLANAFPSAWFAKDAAGNRIRTKEYGDYVMAIWNTGFQTWVAQKCLSELAFTLYPEGTPYPGDGYDGCLVDAIGTAVLKAGYASGYPINPATGQVFTNAQWLQAANRLLKKMRDTVGPDVLLIPNGLRSGTEYFDVAAPTGQLLTYADGGFVELFARGPKVGINAYKTEVEWKKDVDMIVDAGKRGKSLFTVTKVWTAGTQLQKDNWHRFSLGTFLLGTNGLQYFSFLYDDLTTITPHPWWETDLGAPLASYFKSGVTYQRNFANGKVIVNPSTATSAPVWLGGASYKDLSGAIVKSVTLAPRTATILVKV